MDRFIDKIREEINGEILGELEIVRIPLNLCRARNATSRQWLTAGPADHPFARSAVFLAGDSAIGSPYCQSISLGFECAMLLSGLIAQPDVPLREMFDRYERPAMAARAQDRRRSRPARPRRGTVGLHCCPSSLYERCPWRTASNEEKEGTTCPATQSSI